MFLCTHIGIIYDMQKRLYFVPISRIIKYKIYSIRVLITYI